MYLQKSQMLNLSFENQIVVQDQQAPQETLTLLMYTAAHILFKIYETIQEVITKTCVSNGVKVDWTFELLCDPLLTISPNLFFLITTNC